MPSAFRLLYLVTEDWAFLSHRLPMAKAAQKAGFKVGVICRVSSDEEKIRALGFDVYPIEWQRRSLNLFAAIKNILHITRIYRTVKPDIVHHVALKPVIFGSIAAQLARVPAIVNSQIGLGYVFINQNFTTRILRSIIVVLLRLLYAPRNTYAIMQNRDDQSLLTSLKILKPKRTHLIRGSGIELDHYQILPEPSALPVYFGFAGRILADKGVYTLIESYKRARDINPGIGLVLAGTPDPENPASISEAEIREWEKIPGIEWRGKVDDIRTVWRDCHVAVLPSRREGLPKSLLEAAACQRALIATDVPGCREIVEDGKNGFLVTLDDADALAKVMLTLAGDTELRNRFALASRRMVESDLSAEAVGKAITDLYQKAVNKAQA